MIHSLALPPRAFALPSMVRLALGGAVAAATLHAAPQELPRVPASIQGTGLFGENQQLDPFELPYTGEYPALYTERNDSASFNVEVMRGMVVSADGRTLYAINSYASSILRFDIPSGPPWPIFEQIQPTHVWPTLVDPVAIAWAPDGDLLVLGQGTHGLARHSITTGEMVSLFTADGFDEPADLVVDGALGQAYVSCMGSDSVFRLDVTERVTTEIERYESQAGRTGYPFQVKRPRFLHWQPGAGGQPGALYVAPFLSGNNTFVLGGTDGSGTTGDKIIDGYGPSVLAEQGVQGLPDVDLFRITPATGQIDPIFRRVAHLMTGHGLDPVSGNYWMLGVEAGNARFATEPVLKGIFARNVATAQSLPIRGLPHEVHPDQIWDLDEPVGGQYDPIRSVPFPYAIEFAGPDGMVAVASSTLPRVALMDAAGSKLGTLRWDGSDGQVVRDLAFIEEGLLIYCQQSSNIMLWPIASSESWSVAPVVHFQLLSDPTPEQIQQGRGLFYDASLSQDARTTCATCHPGGESDVLAWNLSEINTDFKDPMVTQTLKGLRETFPYHWRGERRLHDFNAAFVGLLGGDQPLSGDGGGGPEMGDLDAFEAFLFSLRPSANPHATLDRTMPKTLEVESMGKTGQVWAAAQHFAGFNCNQCHMLPTGGVGSLQPDNFTSAYSDVAHAANIETIQLSNFIAHREQFMRSVRVEDPNGGPGDLLVTRPQLGAGVLHNGAFPSFAHFIEARFADVFMPLWAGRQTPETFDQAGANGAAFVRVLDTGTPPAAHWGAVLDAEAPGDTLQQIQSILLRQAKGSDPWVELVVRGYSPVDLANPGPLSFYSWLYEPAIDRFVPDVAPTAPNYPGLRQLRDFAQFNLHPTMRHHFLFVPLGKGDRLGRDWDGDHVINGAEGAFGRWKKDQDGDGEPDGYSAADDATAPGIVPGSFRLLMARATHAEFVFEATEDVRWSLRIEDVTGTQQYYSEGVAFGRQHTIHAHELHPGAVFEALAAVAYVGELTITDRAGLSTTHPLPFGSFRTTGDRGGVFQAAVPNRSIITRLWLPQAGAGEIFTPDGTGSFLSTARVQVGDYEEQFYPPVERKRTVIAQVLRYNASNSLWEPVPADELEHNGMNSLNGPGGPPSAHQSVDKIYGGEPYPVFTGPLIVLPETDVSNGQTQVTWKVTENVGVGQGLGFLIVAVLESEDNMAEGFEDPEFPTFLFAQYMMGATKPENRVLLRNLSDQ